MKILLAAAATVALLACSDQQSPAAQAAEGAAPKVEAKVATAAAAYAPYLEKRYPASGKAVAAAEVAGMIERDGPQKAVAALWGEGADNGWEAVMRGIAKGEPAWLALAPAIAKGADAGASTGLAMASQDALTTNAAGALRLMAQLGDGDAGCTYESFEDPPEQSRAFYAAATAGVEAVTEPALQNTRDACLAQLRSGAAQS
jgi:hypothetical protein